eukprot:317324_1
MDPNFYMLFDSSLKVAHASYLDKPVNEWTTQDFMSFISSLDAKPNSYNQIKIATDENGLVVTHKGKPKGIQGLFGINIITPKKILKASMQLDRTLGGVQNVKTQSLFTSSTTNHASPTAKEDGFLVNLRGKQAKMITLRSSFTKDSIIGDVVRSYKEQECVKMSSKAEDILVTTGNKVLQHDKTLAHYGIVSSDNLIDVAFKIKGGSDDWESRTVDEWDTEDLKAWMLTQVPKADQQRISSCLDDNGFTGSDLKDAEIEDIKDALKINTELAEKLHRGLQDWKPSPLPYYIGYLLDCMDFKGIWCVAQVTAVNVYSITVKYILWKTNFPQDTLTREQIKDRCRGYGEITYKENTNCNVYESQKDPKRDNVYKVKRKKHPTEEKAKRVRDQQKANLESGTYPGQSDGGLFNVSLPAWLNSNNNVRDIIGLVNLGNQCYLNSAIQLIVNTPPLKQLFRNNDKAKRQPLLFRFTELCKQAQHHSVYKPSAIKNILADEDYGSFGDFSQQDAGHAFSTLLEILDRELLNNESYESDVLNRRYIPGLNSEKNEQTVIKQIMDEYNPNNQSVIRDKMTFILRETYECMSPNCDYMETKHNYLPTLVLPLENHSLTVPVTIYSTESSDSIEKSLICLSYCGLRTLTAQIHEVLRPRNTHKDIRFAIDLYSVEYNHPYGGNTLIDPCQILKPVDLNRKCEYLIGKSVLAIAKGSENDTDDDEMKEHDALLMKQFSICIDNKGKVKNNGFQFNVIATTIGTRVHDLPQLIQSKGTRHIYYQSRILQPKDTSTVQRTCDVMVIVYSETSSSDLNSESLPYYVGYLLDCKDGIGVWCEAQVTAMDVCADSITVSYINWGGCTDTFDRARRKTHCLGYGVMTNKDNTRDVYSVKRYIRPKKKDAKDVRARQEAVLQLRKSETVLRYLSSALRLDIFAKCTQIYRKPLSTILECLEAYFETQVWDAGAAVSCTNCKRCKVFRQSTTIVRYPEICTLLLDRFDNGRKYDQKVAFSQSLKLGPELDANYDLYAVSNHASSSIDFGHYYSYVKSVDKNDSVWYEANDRHITAIGNETVTNNRNALVLMYQKAKQ